MTLKYNADGHQNWAFTTFDTVRGLGLALRSDKAVVVVGQSPLRVMHYKQDGVVSTTPVLAASADKVSGPAPLTVAFTPVAVDLFAPNYQWDFGDGVIARNAAGLHTFAAGTYAVMVHAVFGNGAVLSSDPLGITATDVPLPPVPSSLVLGSSSVVGGKGTTGTVTVSGTAGAVVVLGSGNTTLVKVPASVQVAAGATSASFKITTSRVRTTTPVTITATANGASTSATLTLTR